MLKQFTIITTVWGKTHTNIFLNIGMPSLLAPGNLPKLATLTKVKYVIYTRPEEAKMLEDSIVYAELCKCVNVSLVIFTEKIINNHITMTDYHKAGLEVAVRDNSYAVFIPPDCIWSNNSMSSMYDIVSRGYKIIHMSGIRLISELFYNEYALKSGTNIDVPARELVAKALPVLHPISNSHFFEERGTDLMPANLFWSVGKTGIIARNFHLHPLLINAIGKDINFESTIDDDLALGFDASKNEEYVVTDSDELLAFEISALSHNVMAAYRKSNVEDIALWAEFGTNFKHRQFIKSVIKIHSDKIDTVDWELVEKKSTGIVRDVLSALENINKLKKNFSLHRLYFILYKNNNTKKIMPIVSKWLYAFVNFLQKAFYSENRTYPWYWNHNYHAQVSETIVNDFKSLRGNILCFNDLYTIVVDRLARIAEDTNNCQLDIRDLDTFIGNIASFSLVYRGHYDNIIVISSDNSVLERMSVVIKSVSKPNAKVYIYSNEDVTVEFVRESAIVLDKQKNLGLLGTKLLLTASVWYRKNLTDKFTIFNYSMVRNVLKIISAPIMIVANPLISLIVSVVNCFSNKQEHYAIKQMVYSKN